MERPRNGLRGMLGVALHAVLCGAGHTPRLPLPRALQRFVSSSSYGWLAAMRLALAPLGRGGSLHGLFWTDS